MTTGFVIPAKALIDRLAFEFKEQKIIEAPEWSKYVKTSHAKENPPDNEEMWYYVRAASVLRKLYFKGALGVQNLRKLYSHPKNRGSAPNKSIKSSAKILRSILQNFEKAEFVKSTPNGRTITPKGISFIDKLAGQMKDDFPEIAHY